MSEVAKILLSYPPDCQASAVESLGNAGGLSGARFWRIVAPRGALGLRCWPIEQPTPERLEFIHAVLRHAAGLGIDFLPVPIATSRGETFVRHEGRLWELTPWLPGESNYEQSPTNDKLRAAMIALAKFHLAVGDFPSDPRIGPAPGITQRLARLRELSDGGLAELTSAIDDGESPEFSSLARQIADKLPRVVPVAMARLEPLNYVPLPLQICIRDVWSDNVLFAGDKVSGLVDFGAVDVDTPATDVARLLGSLAGDDRERWNLGLTAYSTFQHLSDDETQAIAALDIAGTVLGGCNWIRWIFAERRTFENADRVRQRLSYLAMRTSSITL